jgi:plastocyanin
MQSRRFPVLSFLLFVALVIPALSGLAVARAHPTDSIGLPAAELYVTDGYARNWTALDAGTLDPRTDSPEINLGSPGVDPSTLPVLSADGSTLVQLGAGGKIVVRAGLLGPERIRFSPDVTVGDFALSRDGRRLVVYAIGDALGDALSGPAWRVFDTGDGRLVASIQGGEGRDPWETFAIDADAHRLYRLALDPGGDQGSSTGPQPTQLIANDLATGSEVGRIALPQVRAGFWQSEETVTIGGGEEPLMRELIPALAVSPDGRHVAVVHAEEEAMTLVDSERMAIDQTLELEHPASAWSRLLAWASLSPQSASAKALEGTERRAVFAPDGARLFVSGTQARVEDGEPVFHGLGLRAIDIETGDVGVELSGDAPIDRIVPSPDGGSLYVITSVTNPATEPTAGTMPFLLRRLDAETLEPIAERAFKDWPRFLLRSTLADPTLPLTIELVDMAFAPSVVTVPVGSPVQLVVANHGATTHSLKTGDESGTWEVHVDVAPGETEAIVIDAPAAGEYKMFCDVAGHAEAGMGGVLVAR